MRLAALVRIGSLSPSLDFAPTPIRTARRCIKAYATTIIRHRRFRQPQSSFAVCVVARGSIPIIGRRRARFALTTSAFLPLLAQ